MARTSLCSVQIPIGVADCLKPYLRQISKAKSQREGGVSDETGDLRRQNADDAKGTFNRSRCVAMMSGFAKCVLMAAQRDARSGWPHSEEENVYKNTPLC